jgi:outer membrane immunogenic protein
MKRIAIALLAGAAAVAGLGQSASAADLAVRAAPAPVVVPTWTGLYIGAHGGAAWQSTPGWNFTDPGAALATLNVNHGGNSLLGGVGGFQFGYNWQFAPAWVVGVEGDWSWASMSDHRTVGPILTAGGAIVGTAASSVQMSANTQWLASARARLGFTGWLNNTLFYVTGGGAWADVEFSGTATTLTAAGTLLSSSNAASQKTLGGWVAGAGAEFQATQNILLRAEYLYYGFSGATSIAAPFSPVGAPTAGAVAYNFDKFNVQVFRVGASYKF